MMNTHRGFTSFEFYFVMAVIGVIMLVGLQRYMQLAEQTQRFGFELLSQRFSTSVYNLRVKWMLSLQVPNQNNLVDVEGERIQFTPQGWPLAKAGQSDSAVTIESCRYLWYMLEQNPEPISYEGGDKYGSRPYHLSVTPEKNCRYEFITRKPLEYYFDYSPQTGRIFLHTPVAVTTR